MTATTRRRRASLSHVRAVPLIVFQGVAVVGAFALGVVGWAQYSGPSAPANGSDVAYNALELFFGNVPNWDTTRLPTTLQIARFLAPLSLVVLVASALVTLLLGDRAKRALTRLRMTRHGAHGLIICGRGDPAAKAALGEADDHSHDPIVLVSPDEPGNRRELELAGVVCIRGDSGREELLQSLSVARAHALLALDEDKEQNARTLLAAERAASHSTKVQTHIAGSLRDELWMPSGPANGSDRQAPTRRTIVDVDRIMATAIIRSLDPFPQLRAGQAAGSRTIIVASEDDVAEAVVVEAARAWKAGHATAMSDASFDGDSLTILLAASKASERVRRLLVREPALERLIALASLDEALPELDRRVDWSEPWFRADRTDLIVASAEPLKAMAIATSGAPSVAATGGETLVATSWQQGWDADLGQSETVKLLDLGSELARSACIWKVHSRSGWRGLSRSGGPQMATGRRQVKSFDHSSTRGPRSTKRSAPRG